MGTSVNLALFFCPITSPLTITPFFPYATKSVYNECMRKIIMTVKKSIGKNPDVFFFFLFIFSLPLSIFTPAVDGETIYTTGPVYFSDILFIFAVILWIIKEHKNIILSRVLSRDVFLFTLSFFLWALLSSFWAKEASVAFFRAIEILQFSIIFFYVAIRIVPRRTFLIGTLFSFTVSGVVNASIGIFQFLSQKSIGLAFLGESILFVDKPGVASVIIGGQEILRSYGLFTHPNVFGGFLIFSLFSNIFLFLSIKYFVPRGTVSLFFYKESFLRKFLAVFIIIQCGGIVLTFSKTAIIGVFVATIFSILALQKEKMSENSSFFDRVKTLEILIRKSGTKRNIIGLPFLIVFLIASFLVLKNIDYSYFYTQSLSERKFYQDISLQMIVEHPIIGVGAGQFVQRMDDYVSYPVSEWQHQPVHNIFLLVFSELGIIGLILFLIIIISAIYHSHSVPRGTLSVRKFFLSVLIALLFIGLFDHYLWDLQQGQFLLWILFGLIFPIIEEKKLF